MKVFLHFVCVLLGLLRCSSVGWKEALSLIERVMACFSDFRCCARGKRELSFAWLVSFCSFPVSDVLAQVMCHCRYGATSPASSIIENKINEACVGSTLSEVGFMFTRRARGHRRLPAVLTSVHNSEEHPVVEQCF